MAYRLIKTEPYKYNRDQFIRDGKTMWDGVRNYQARNNLQSMLLGDLCLRYHSNEGKEIVGVAQVVRTAYPDPTAATPNKDGRVVVDVVPYATFLSPVTLAMIKQDPKLRNIGLLRQPRLSVVLIHKDEFDHICNLGKIQLLR